MAEEKSLVENMREGMSEVQDRAEEMLQKVWPFRRKAEENGQREAVPFPIDVYETEEDFVLVGDMPGVKKDGVKVQVTENELTITGRFQSALEREEMVAFREIPGADYQRTFTLSDAVDREKITAELKDGVLTIHLAKSESVKPREIQITE